MLGRVTAWLEDRSGLGPETVRALDRETPKGVGWWDTLGAVALSLIGLLAITGMFMALYYSPHPDGAYDSTHYLREQVPGGRLLLSLHHYGDSALVIVLGLYVLRSVLIGAYKAPRELVWLLAIVLLNLALIFGITGHLLPWDQKGYRSTEVRTSFPAGVPIVGPLIRRVLLGDDDISALSLTRFYALHTLFLPAVLVPVLALFGYVGWKKGATAPGTRVDEIPTMAGRFSETRAFKNACASAAVVVFLIGLSWVHPAELEFRYSPADGGYHARPDWYFLSLFQLLNDLKALPLPSWMLALGLPGAVMTALVLLPWLDRSPERDWRKRKLFVLPVGVGLLVVSLLTVRASTLLARNATPSESLFGHVTAGGENDLSTMQLAAGKAAFQKGACMGCHKAYAEFSTGSLGPDLTGYGRTTFLTEVAGHPEMHSLSFYDRFVRYVRGDVRPKDASGAEKTTMPKYSAQQLSDQDLTAIAAFLSQEPPPHGSAK